MSSPFPVSPASLVACFLNFFCIYQDVSFPNFLNWWAAHFLLNSTKNPPPNTSGRLFCSVYLHREQEDKIFAFKKIGGYLNWLWYTEKLTKLSVYMHDFIQRWKLPLKSLFTSIKIQYEVPVIIADESVLIPLAEIVCLFLNVLYFMKNRSTKLSKIFSFYGCFNITETWNNSYNIQ